MTGPFQKRMRGFFALVYAVFLVQGCGVKGPPTAPAPDPLPAVTDLRLTRGPQGIWLAWSLPEPVASDPDAAAAFIVYRARMEASAAAACRDCPVVYARAAQVPLSFRGEKDSAPVIFGYEDRLEPGFTYTYKICLADKTGREGPDSNTVRIAFDDSIQKTPAPSP